MIRYLTLAVMLAVPSIEPPEDSLSRWKSNIARHQKVVMYGVPSPYDAVRDPTPDNDEKLRRGAALFDRQCSSCHGWSGRGTGPEGFFLVPAPADLAWLAQTPRRKGRTLYLLEHCGRRRSVRFRNAGVQAHLVGGGYLVGDGIP
jgi:hypothetical protein